MLKENIEHDYTQKTYKGFLTLAVKSQQRFTKIISARITTYHFSGYVTEFSFDGNSIRKSESYWPNPRA